jgi:predicted RNA methylase
MLDQFFTPPDLAARMVEWAGVKSGMDTLEPSAGLGAIVKPLRATGAMVTAYEKDEGVFLELSRSVPRGVLCLNEDFLHSNGGRRWDVAVMNPPYSLGQDSRHVLKACGVADRVVVLGRVNLLAGVDHHLRIWSRCGLSRLAILTRRPQFSGPADKGFGARHDMAVFEIRYGWSGSTAIEWW